MEGKAPFEKLRELGHDLPEDFALFPPTTLDTISTSWLLETGNDLLAHYTWVLRCPFLVSGYNWAKPSNIIHIAPLHLP